MSLISERVGFLLQQYSPENIAEVTNLSVSTMSPSLGELEPVEPSVRRNVYNYYNRTVYAMLRKVGASATEARSYRNRSVALVIARLGDRSALIDRLVNARFETYKAYLEKVGRYTDDENTLTTLRESIARNMGKSRLPPSHYDYESYGTVEHPLSDE